MNKSTFQFTEKKRTEMKEEEGNKKVKTSKINKSKPLCINANNEMSETREREKRTSGMCI